MTQEKSIETSKGRVYYWLTPGSSDKPIIVFLHGLSSNHLTWDPIVEIMHKHGYGTLAVDIRGHGLSDKTRRRALYKIPVMVRDLEKILEVEKILNFCLVGYSYGAYVGMDFASAHPHDAKGLVLISANHVSPFKYHWYSFVNPIARWGVNLFGWLLIWQKRKKYYYFNPKKARGYWKSTFTGYATMPLSINFWMLSEVFAMDYRDTVPNIGCPTLIIKGENDNFITEAETQDLVKQIPQAEAITLGSGHYVAAYYQELTAEKILDFVKKLS